MTSRAREGRRLDWSSNSAVAVAMAGDGHRTRCPRQHVSCKGVGLTPQGRS